MRFLSVLLSLWLSGCLFVMDSDTSHLMSLKTDRRPTAQALVDASLEVSINKKLKEQQFAQHCRIKTLCFHQHVLVLGHVPQTVMIDQISHVISEVEGIKKIYNEVHVDATPSFWKRSQDFWITSQIKTRMMLNPNIKPWKLQVITESGIVYLVGLVKPQEEQAAVEIASSVHGVEKVVKILERVI